jgi:hypothetical protein
VAPDSEILVRVGEEECLKATDINPHLALNKKMNIHNDLFLDRRDKIYYR